MSPHPSVLVPLAAGFEEIEAVTIVDVLRRAQLPVTVAGLGQGPQKGSRGVVIVPDVNLADVDLDGFDAIVLPGGMGGTLAMVDSEALLDALRRHAAAGKWIGAICAAPLVLAAAGLAEGLELTSHPSVRDRLPGATVVDAPRVVRSGRFLTSQGPGTSLAFALELVRELRGPEVRDELARAMVCDE